MAAGSLLNIPTEYDAEVRVSVAPDTMIFLGALILVALAARKRKFI